MSFWNPLMFYVCRSSMHTNSSNWDNEGDTLCLYLGFTNAYVALAKKTVNFAWELPENDMAILG